MGGVINGRTGEVQGEQPWRKTKIALTVILGILLVAVFAYLLYLTSGK